MTFLRTRNFNTCLPRMESNRTVTKATKITAISTGLFCFFLFLMKNRRPSIVNFDMPVLITHAKVMTFCSCSSEEI